MDAENNTTAEQSETTGSIFKPKYYAANNGLKGYKYVALFSLLTLFSYFAALGFAYFTITASDEAPIVITSVGALIMAGLTILLAVITLIMWALNIYEMARNRVFTLYSTFYILLPVIVFFITVPILLG